MAIKYIIRDVNDSAEYEVYHTGMMSISDYMPKTGGTFSGPVSTADLTVNGKLTGKDGTFSGAVAFMNTATFTGKVTANGGMKVSGNIETGSLTIASVLSVGSNGIETNVHGNFNSTVTFKNSASFNKSIQANEGMLVTGGTMRVRSNALFSTLPTFKDGVPTINVAVGDSDTGFHSTGDGACAFWRNNVKMYEMSTVHHAGNFNPASKANLAGANFTGNVTVANNANLTVTGAIHSNNDITGFSDRRLKENIVELNGESEAIQSLNKLKVYTYKSKINGATQYGVMSDEMSKVYPNLVKTINDVYAQDSDGKWWNTLLNEEVTEDDKCAYDAVNYMQLVPLLLAKVNRLENTIEDIGGR